MNTLEIIRNGLMQCIEKIEELIKRMSKTEETVAEQGNTLMDAKISLSVMENFASSQFANFTYLYYEENGEIKSILFNDGNVDSPNVKEYTISGKPVSYKCYQSTSKVVFKDFDTSSLTDMSYMFNSCDKLTTLDLSNFNTSAVMDMGSMFYYCSKLTTLDLSSFNTSAVTNMSRMFGNCRNLTTLDLSSFNTSSVTNMTYMFGNCRNLTTLDLSSFNTSAVTEIGNMFLSCDKLTTIIGTHTLEEVQAGTIKAMRGLKFSINFSYSPNLERASILALFYGLADLTGKTKETIQLHSTAKARLTAEDIKIATDKNWDVQ